ncbi:AMIN-like domain-containing (lipo)protein [Nonomuraea endophytica]|uniref:AMIN-like domain-containing (lipo)protein n=1 Tax=Nonomuraea endophytica TaxID=714136 RepID=UPI0037C7E987
MRPTRSFAALLCLAVLCGCGTARTGGTTATASPPTSAPTPTISSPPASPQEPAPTGTAEVEVDRSGGVAAVVTGVRYATHPNFDRVVVDLKGKLPGYTVTWVDELVEDGSGKPIDVEGGAYLQVILTPADAHTAKGKPTWAGGPIFQADLGNVSSVVKTGDFEGRVGVGIALDRRAGFEVTEQHRPNRLVIDVAH